MCAKQSLLDVARALGGKKPKVEESSAPYERVFSRPMLGKGQDPRDIQTGDFVTYWDKNGAFRAQFVEAYGGKTVRLAPTKFGKWVLAKGISVSLDRIHEVLRPNPGFEEVDNA